MLGEVLCVQAHHRLSHVVRLPEASAVYMTWLLRRRVEGCICRLHMDEAETSDIADLQDVWLPIWPDCSNPLGASGGLTVEIT